MCISAPVSFTMAGLLVAGGVVAANQARKIDARYLPLAVFPILVGIQQFAEGLVWLGAGNGNESLAYMAALGYLFFTWMVWPAWVPYMSAALETERQKQKLFIGLAQIGFILGLILYVPNFWNPQWLHIEIVKHAIVYQCVLMPDFIMPREVTALLYLAIIALPPLLSSHRSLKIFGIGLLLAVPLTYYFYAYAQISVLCFFAAVLVLYLLYIIFGNRCAMPGNKYLGFVDGYVS